MQGRYRRVEDKPGHDQVGVELRISHAYGAEGEIARGLVAQHKPCQQQQAAGSVHQQISVARGQRLLAPPEPHQKHGRKGHQLPKEKERQVVPAKDDAQ